MTKLTKQDAVILSVMLDDHPLGSHTLARVARIRTMSPAEAAARHAIKLTKLGFAEKKGTRMFPAWQRTAAGREALQAARGGQ